MSWARGEGTGVCTGAGWPVSAGRCVMSRPWCCVDNVYNLLNLSCGDAS